jgi:two-component system nitrogen regulation sensor histidine kinase NtrY
MGQSLSEIVPELNDLMATARSSAQRLLQGQIEINRDNIERQLSVRVSSEQTGQSNESYIITLDDITELVTAQRTSAWADVARRIAHEIKNPLTDSIVCRAYPPQVRQGYYRRSPDLRSMHGYHYPSGR